MATKKQFFKLSAVLLLLSGWLASCTPYKEIPYFSDISSTDSSVYNQGVQRPRTHFQALKIRTGDILEISIQTIIPSTAEDAGSISASPVITSGLNSISGTGTGTGTSSMSSSSSMGAPTYVVDQNGEIELPLVGEITVAGLTLSQIKEKLRKCAERYYKEPIVNVRLANFKVTVLGAVGAPGTYVMDQQKATILDALGMAHDLSIEGKRTNILLSREVGGKQQFYRFNIDSSKIFNSPFFYLKQGDVVYVQPTQGAAAANNANVFRILTLGTTLVSLTSLILAISTRSR